MTQRRFFKAIHFISTIWFVASVAFIIIYKMRQEGYQWWLILSLSGFSAVFTVFLLSVYLVAIFRGAVRSQEPEIEHPLSSMPAYMVLYSISPILGGLAGLLGTIGVEEIDTVNHYISLVFLGTIGATFLFWVIVDPMVAIIETVLPECRNHRRQRLAHAKALREQQQKQRIQLLAEMEDQENSLYQNRSKVLARDAEKLAELMIEKNGNHHKNKKSELSAVDIGVRAWQQGGIVCMQQLHDMAVDICKKEYPSDMVDYITIWWDGIGNWRNPSLAVKI